MGMGWSMIMGMSFSPSSQPTRPQYKQTWQHPKSKQWSCIDFVITHQRDRRMCVDPSVRRGAECNTDHQMLCATLSLMTENYRTPVPPAESRRYDVSSLAHVEVRGTEGN